MTAKGEISRRLLMAESSRRRFALCPRLTALLGTQIQQPTPDRPFVTASTLISTASTILDDRYLRSGANGLCTEGDREPCPRKERWFSRPNPMQASQTLTPSRNSDTQHRALGRGTWHTCSQPLCEHQRRHHQARAAAAPEFGAYTPNTATLRIPASIPPWASRVCAPLAGSMRISLSPTRSTTSHFLSASTATSTGACRWLAELETC